MTTTVGAYQAKTNFSQLIERVAQGERITITKYGVPVAVISPAQPETTRPVSEVIDEIKEFRRSFNLDGESLREMIEEGRA